MGVLLAPDTVTVWQPSRTDDGHGWSSGEEFNEAGSFLGNLQASVGPGTTDLSGGDSGAYEPTERPTAVLYAPLDAEVSEGDVCEVDGVRWRVTSAVVAKDPRATGEAGCRVLSLVRWSS